ncbi:MAG: hypothetical protein HC933_00145 [Pleurocapsa sp. SU_196_0]|nr:hypothetical protein [Pleurocapsa sp. SU_196_0]
MDVYSTVIGFILLAALYTACAALVTTFIRRLLARDINRGNWHLVFWHGFYCVAAARMYWALLQWSLFVGVCAVALSFVAAHYALRWWNQKLVSRA